VEQLFALHDMSAQMAVSALLERNADEAARSVDKYCEKARQLDGDARFKDSSANPTAGSDQDAAYFLAPLVDWFTGQAPGPNFVPQQRGLLHLPEALSARIDAAKRNWTTELNSSDVASLDFSWMKLALQYAHWSLASAGPIADQHLAWLVHTTGGTIADNVSLRMSGLSGATFKVASQAGVLPSGLVSADPAAMTQLDELSRAGAAFFWPGVEPAVMKRARDCAPSPCSSFMEGAFLRKTLGQLSPANTDDAFWSIGESIQSCDKGLLDLVRLSQPKSNEQALSLLQTLPQPPLERLFGPAGEIPAKQ
jgi:hypothetical protein